MVKKLMMMFAAVALAGAAQAAYVEWGFVTDVDMEQIQDTTGAQIDWSKATAILFYGTVTTDLTAGTYDLGTATQVATGASRSNNVTSDLFSSAGGEAYSIVLVDKSGLTSLDGYSGNMAVVTGTTENVYGLYATAVSITDVWQSSWHDLSPAAAPEPTSGLLLLVGGALLALRRKRLR